jgi:hypothetical protein
MCKAGFNIQVQPVYLKKKALPERTASDLIN